MGKRYYCDYCERTFIDDIQARKKHLLGLKHSIRVKEHYNSFKDAKTILSEEKAKIPCFKYLRTGECAFGLNCRHSHFSKEQLFALTEEVHKIQAYEAAKSMDEERKLEQALSKDPGLPLWLLKKKNRVKLSSDKSVPGDLMEGVAPVMDDLTGIEDSGLRNVLTGADEYPPNVASNFGVNIAQLPPSLRPMSSDDLLNATWEEWG